MDQGNKTQQLSESAAMKKMVLLAAKLYAGCPQLYEGSKAQSFLLTTASNPESGFSLPPLPAYQGLQPQSTSRHSEMTPLMIQQEYEGLQQEFEKELKLREDMNQEKQKKLRVYINKEQEYRERIEEYNKNIK